MKVFYIGCKSLMKAQKMAFPRGEEVEVTEPVGIALLKIDGFVDTLNAAAKKELKMNVEREKAEREKLASGVRIVEVQNPKLEDEIELLKLELEEATNGTQLAALMSENEKLKAQIAKVAKV